MKDRLRRALLYIPGDSERKLEKGAGLGVDSLIIDFEDGVAVNRKVEARPIARGALETLDFGRSERLVRVNPVGSGLEMEELAATIDCRPDGYVIPKAETAAQVMQISNWLANEEKQRGWDEGEIVLMAYIETALGVVNLKEIAASTPRLAALMFGAGDFASDIGATRTEEATEVLYARSAMVTHAKAYGLQAIDTPYLDIHNLEGLAGDTRRSIGMGFDGKTAIHPKQPPVIEAAFMPTSDQITWAEGLLAASEAHQEDGRGVFVYEGKMVDMPDFRAARNIMARARAGESAAS